MSDDNGLTEGLWDEIAELEAEVARLTEGWNADIVETEAELDRMHALQNQTARFRDQYMEALTSCRAENAKLEGEQAWRIRLQDELVELREAVQAAFDCGMIPHSTAAEGGAARYSEQVRVADMLRAALLEVSERLVLTGGVFVDGNVLAEGYPHKKEVQDEV